MMILFQALTTEEDDIQSSLTRANCKLLTQICFAKGQSSKGKRSVQDLVGREDLHNGILPIGDVSMVRCNIICSSHKSLF